MGGQSPFAYAREGADILFAFLESDSDADETTRLIRGADRKAIAVKGDVGDEAFCLQLVERAVAELSGLDILVSNAAYQQTHKGIEDIPSEEIERVFRTNILAMFWLCKTAAPHLRPGGVIVNMASTGAYSPKPSQLHY
ncbi:MAG TPA: SDR family NAD(P)-dependent oxidoreductase, partial [Ktedonobacterales bacterium]|nr:SDR family NAD(P)-dependent oxidoreductase [Ktedonobacterales bacterium]